MRSRAEIKIDAKRKLNAYWKIPVLVCAVIFLVTAILSIFEGRFGTLISFLFSSVASVYSSMLNLNVAKNDNLDPVDFSWMQVSKEKLLKCLIYSALMSIGTFLITYLGNLVGPLTAFLVSIFILILEIYLSFSVLAILDTDAPIVDGIKISMNLIEGNFFGVIVFGLSFLGWFILGGITLGIGFLWIFPYFSISFANYYLELKRTKSII